MMMQSFFRMLVPDVCVESVRVVNAYMGYYLLVQPDHQEYWIRFRNEFPELITLACRDYGASARRVEDDLPYLCPVFASKEDLIGWLTVIFRLTRGEKNLLRLCMA